MTTLQPFIYGSQEVRTILIDGEPWFVLADICNSLGLARRPSAVAERLDDDVRQTYPIQDSFGRVQNAIIVNEAGMFDVIVRSDSPNARPFRRWVTHEVLPSIRKTGAYGTPALPRTLPEALRQYADEVEAHEQTRQIVAALEPKANAWHDLVSSAGSLSFRDAAKVISEEGGVNISGPRLIETLARWRWIFRPPATPEEQAKGKQRSIRAYQTQIDAGTLTEKAKTYTDQKTGEKKLSNNPQTRVTGRGLDVIRTRLLKEMTA